MLKESDSSVDNSKFTYLRKALNESFSWAFGASVAVLLLFNQAANSGGYSFMTIAPFVLSIIFIWLFYFSTKKHMKKLGECITSDYDATP